MDEAEIFSSRHSISAVSASFEKLIYRKWYNPLRYVKGKLIMNRIICSLIDESGKRPPEPVHDKLYI